MSKYNNKKTEVDGIVFDSKKEANKYQELKLLKMAGEIKDFDLQPVFVLQEKFEKNGKKFREIKYIADFKVIENDGTVRIIDTKGFRTKDFELKLKMFEYKYLEYQLEVI